MKAQLSSVLREVEKGTRVRVTSRGRPVAEIVPAESPEERRQRMIEEGRVTPATRLFPKDAPPPRDTGRSASAFILAERDEER